MSDKSANQAQKDANEAKGKKTALTQAEKGPGDLVFNPDEHTPVAESGWVHKGGPPDGGPELAAGSKERAATDNAMDKVPKDLAEAIPKASIADPVVAQAEGIPYAVINEQGNPEERQMRDPAQAKREAKAVKDEEKAK